MYSENYNYGRGKNAADNLPKVGRRTQNMEQQVTVTSHNPLLDPIINCRRNEIKS